MFYIEIKYRKNIKRNIKRNMKYKKNSIFYKVISFL